MIVDSFTNYAPDSSPIERIDITDISSIIVPVTSEDIKMIEDALEQEPAILHVIEDSTITVLQKIASLRTIATRLSNKQLISLLFLQRLVEGLSDKAMNERLTEARNMLRTMGVGNVKNASHRNIFSPQHGGNAPPTPTNRNIGS